MVAAKLRLHPKAGTLKDMLSAAYQIIIVHTAVLQGLLVIMYMLYIIQRCMFLFRCMLHTSMHN